MGIPESPYQNSVKSGSGGTRGSRSLRSLQTPPGPLATRVPRIAVSPEINPSRVPKPPEISSPSFVCAPRREAVQVTGFPISFHWVPLCPINTSLSRCCSEPPSRSRNPDWVGPWLLLGVSSPPTTVTRPMHKPGGLSCPLCSENVFLLLVVNCQGWWEGKKSFQLEFVGWLRTQFSPRTLVPSFP